MKRTIKTIALCAVLGFSAVGCQKEEHMKNINVVAADETSRTVVYSIDGQSYRIELKGDEAWHAFLERMAIMAMDGYEVVFWNENQVQQGIPSKDVVTYTTADEKDAISWCNSMFDAGYKVSMTYDTTNHVFVCIAIK